MVTAIAFNISFKTRNFTPHALPFYIQLTSVMLLEGLHDTESRLSSVQVGVLWLARVMYHISLILIKSIFVQEPATLPLRVVVVFFIETIQLLESTVHLKN